MSPSVRTTTMTMPTTSSQPNTNSNNDNDNTLQQQVESIRGRLQTSIGLHASHEWLQACVNHVRHKSHDVWMDAVLHQALHSDIRTVVRRRRGTDGDVSTAVAAAASAVPPPDAVRRLRRAVRDSNHRASQQLRSSIVIRDFAVLLQLEEAIDVGLSCERRLEAARPQAQPPPQPPQQPRCLKLCLTDGFPSDTTPVYYVGMEEEIIPHLTAKSPAGTKLLVRAPLQIRHAQLVLHPGNCVVLGGGVADLQRHQRLALQTAIQEAGVGMDPTLRALVGNHHAVVVEEGHDENDDEAHEASDDVLPSPPWQAPPQPSSMPPPPPAAANPTREVPPYNCNNPYNAATGTTTTARSAWAGSSPVTSTTTTSSTTGMTCRNSPIQPHGTSPPSPPLSRPSTMNPYANSNASTSSTASVRTTTAAAPAVTANPYTTSRTTAAVPSATALRPTVSSNHPYQRSLETSSLDDSHSHPTRSVMPPTCTFGTVTSTPAAPPAAVNLQTMDVSALHQLLTNLMSHRDMYESYYNNHAMAFRVKLQKSTARGNVTFNVVKAKKNRHDKTKRYEFMLATTFEEVGAGNGSHILACRIHPHEVERQFPVSATELRSLCRSDRAKSLQHTDVGGENAKRAFFDRPIVWTATLGLPPDQAFGGDGTASQSIAERLTDEKNPVLMLSDPTPLT